MPALQQLQLLPGPQSRWRRRRSSWPTTTWCWPRWAPKTLPDLDNCLVVFDEAHHLPAVALDQFSSAVDLGQSALAGPAAQSDERSSESPGSGIE
jgi:Rad3-related DNA helicase